MFIAEKKEDGNSRLAVLGCHGNGVNYYISKAICLADLIFGMCHLFDDRKQIGYFGYHGNNSFSVAMAIGLTAISPKI